MTVCGGKVVVETCIDPCELVDCSGDFVSSQAYDQACRTGRFLASVRNKRVQLGIPRHAPKLGLA